MLFNINFIRTMTNIYHSKKIQIERRFMIKQIKNNQKYLESTDSPIVRHRIKNENFKLKQNLNIMRKLKTKNRR